LLGGYDDAIDAAVARDRAVLFHGLDEELNFPAVARRLGPLSPEEIRLAAHSATKDASDSRFVGVHRCPHAEGWDAIVHENRRVVYIARYPTEEEAARAHDRAAAFLGGSLRRLNFPLDPVAPASVAKLRKEAAAARPMRGTSRYDGVDHCPKGRFPWQATLVIGPRRIMLGRWKTERDAALAHDRAALVVLGPRRKLNLPRLARQWGPAEPAELRKEARRLYKLTTTSRYRGVSWSERDQLFVAQIGHLHEQHVLGYFHDEERAAEAYDEAAIRLHGAKAKPNFGFDGQSRPFSPDAAPPPTTSRGRAATRPRRARSPSSPRPPSRRR
jgi:hypothetical protein